MNTKKIQYKGATYVEAKGQAKTFHINVFGVDLVYTDTSPSAALNKFRTILRPSKGLKPNMLKPRLLPPASATRLKTLLQPPVENEPPAPGGEASHPAAA